MPLLQTFWRFYGLKTQIASSRKILHVFIGTCTRYNFQRLVFQFTQMLTTITYHLYCHKAHSALGYVQSTTVLSNTKLEKMRTFLLCLAPLTSNTVDYKQGGPSIRLQVEKGIIMILNLPSYHWFQWLLAVLRSEKLLILSFKVYAQVHTTAPSFLNHLPEGQQFRT